MSNHTPLPWRVDGVCLDCTPVSIWSGRSGALAHVYDFPDPATKNANAEFIVKAVNCHADLLAACKAVLADRENHCQSGHLEMLHNAIAKAEGGQEPASHRLDVLHATAKRFYGSDSTPRIEFQPWTHCRVSCHGSVHVFAGTTPELVSRCIEFEIARRESTITLAWTAPDELRRADVFPARLKAIEAVLPKRPR